MQPQKTQHCPLNSQKQVLCDRQWGFKGKESRVPSQAEGVKAKPSELSHGSKTWQPKGRRAGGSRYSWLVGAVARLQGEIQALGLHGSHRWSSERHADTGEPGQLGNQYGSNLEVLRAPVKLRVARLHMKQHLLHLRRPRSNKEKTGKLTGPPGDAKGVISGSPLGKPHTSLPLRPRGYLRVRRTRRPIFICETPDSTQRDRLSY